MAVRRSLGKILLAGAVLATSLAGCVPSSPDRSGWRSTAEQSVGDMASEVATVRLTLDGVRAGRFVGRYAVVVLARSEKTASSTTEKVTRLQPPAGERARSVRVGSALGDAADLITRTRIALVAGDTERYAALRRHLEQTSEDLERLESSLRPGGATS